jgi:hypothetical protein
MNSITERSPMKRLALIPLMLLLIACPRDKRDADTLAVEPAPVDTTDLSELTTNIPDAAPDTFQRRQPTAAPRETPAATIPQAPPELMAAVEREQSFSRFCYQEFGQKADPSLAGNVAMVVTIGSQGVTDARVGNSRWSSSAAGSAVNRCLNEKAGVAWKVGAGAVRPGKYVVPLSFRGT